MLIFKNLLFTIAVPSTVAGLVPYWIASRQPALLPEYWGAPQYLGIVPFVLGASAYVWCLWDFAVVGRGTPAPIDPPRELVARGLYRYVRNPMYAGVLTVLLGEAVFLESWWLAGYAAGVFVIFHLFVVLHEEPALQRQFGEHYECYRRSVRRWVPGRRRARS